MKVIGVRVVAGLLGLAFVLGFVDGCATSDTRDVGEPCEESDDCADGLECVQFDANGRSCLPAPAVRTPKDHPCLLDGECNLGRTNLWPVEARCDRDTGACVCDADARDCGRGRRLSPECVCEDDG